MAVVDSEARIKAGQAESARDIAQEIPFVIDMGKIKRSQAKKISKGKGDILDHVDNVMQYTKDNLGESTDTRILVPIVILYEKKRKKRRAGRFGLL